MALKEYLTQLQQQMDLWLIEANRMHDSAADAEDLNYWEGMRTAYSKFAAVIQADLANQ